MEADEASTHVLEAVILALVLLSAAYSVTALRDTGGVTDRPRAKLEALTEDALVVLDGLSEERGRLLDLFLAEAYHCATQAVPADSRSCDSRRSANLSLKLQSYLPAGSGYAIGITNGVDDRILYRSLLPAGETVTASRPLVPDWNLTFLKPEMTCLEPGMDAKLIALPIWHGRLSTPVELNVTMGGTINATATQWTDGLWRATIPAGVRLAEGLVHADVNATDGTYPGVTRFNACDLGGLGPSLLTALGSSSFTVSAKASVGKDATITYDVSALSALADAVIVSKNVTFYEPLPPHAQDADSYVPLGTVALPPLESDGTISWTVPPHSLYGAHPAVMTVRVQTPTGTIVDLHQVAVLQVALPNGAVPVDPPYRVFLQTWFPDW